MPCIDVCRIKKNEYDVPSRIGPLARNLIQRLLQHDPIKRPSVKEILQDDFMTMGFNPQRLPVSCLTMAPRFDTKDNASLIARRTPLREVNKLDSAVVSKVGCRCHLIFAYPINIFN